MTFRPIHQGLLASPQPLLLLYLLLFYRIRNLFSIQKWFKLQFKMDCLQLETTLCAAFQEVEEVDTRINFRRIHDNNNLNLICHEVRLATQQLVQEVDNRSQSQSASDIPGH